MNLVEWFYAQAFSPGMLLALIAVVSLVESLALVGLAVPGVVLITALASLAGHQDIAAALILLAAFGGAVVGDGLSFALGSTQRQRIPDMWPFRRHPHWLESGIGFFERYGSLSIVFARFVGPVRPIVPLVAGMLYMPTWKFLWANVGSALLWAPTYVLPGYLLGRNWQRLVDIPPGAERWLSVLAICVVVLALGFSLLRHQLTRRGRLYRLTANLARRYPVTRRLWIAMQAPRPSGEFPLASLSLLMLSLLALCLWTLLVLESNGPLAMDLQVKALFDQWQSPLLVTLGGYLAEAGDTLGVVALILPWLLWLLWARHLSAFLHLCAGLGGIAVANTLFKQLVGRARPDTPDYLTGSFSYPSAHSSTAIVLYGLAAAFIAQELPYRQRIWAYWIAIAICVPMALSRLMIGVHWTSDLIGGALLGLVVCGLVRVSYHRFAHRSLADAPWMALGVASLGLLTLRLALLPPV